VTFTDPARLRLVPTIEPAELDRDVPVRLTAAQRRRLPFVVGDAQDPGGRAG
jgi:hypothetical protein